MADANTTEFPRTIPRHRREKLEAMVKAAVTCTSYTLGSGFVGVDVPLSWVRVSLLGEIASNKPRIRQEGPTKFCVQYHSNHWLEITTA
jgi:hypothetical protein